jgi:hypothetical protein
VSHIQPCHAISERIQGHLIQSRVEVGAQASGGPFAKGVSVEAMGRVGDLAVVHAASEQAVRVQIDITHTSGGLFVHLRL